ncbi:hypothetical protein [Pseudomonas sp. CGJS7]|uniref:hypothetical protein n=1 Tax=Pseudomonas sp. CGJS7 TaxID=3109348 RepID=UPI00300A9D95
MSEPIRHRDSGQWLSSFASRIEVSCPRCGRAGAVRAVWADRQWTAVFVCGQCGLDARSERSDWWGKLRVTGRRPCGYCGYQWLCVDRIRPSAGNWPIEVRDWLATALPEAIAVDCPLCKRASNVAVEARRERDREGHDPHFGMPLRLIERTRAGLLWAYNAEHIDELRRYVAADQRERRCATPNKTMISRLPTWMKLARHRALMLKSLDRLSARLDESASA